MKKIAAFILMLSLTIHVSAQEEPYYKSYDWEANPEYQVNVADSVEIVTYKDKTVREFFFIDENSLVEYDIDHQVLWLNSDKQIEENNKIYLPYSETTELLVNKARVITKEGKVIELDDSKIMTAEDEETNRTYKYYTFEGIEKGSFIEFYNVLMKYPDYNGTRLLLQTERPMYNVDFDLYSPTNLIFKLKEYNGLDSIITDTNITEKRHWSLHIDSLPALENEDQSPYNAYRQFLIYKLDKNIATGKYDMSSYGKSAKNAYSFLYDEATKSENKELAKYLKASGVQNATDEYGKIRTLEDYTKKNIFLVESGNSDLSQISFILKNKVASISGLTRLYARLFQMMEINHQLVMTCNRESVKFDQDFEADNFLTDYLFYFPKIKKFMSPTELNSRLGFPPAELTDNYGLFIKEVSMGEFKTGIGKIKYIEPVAYQNNFDEIILDLKFDTTDLTKTGIEIHKSIGGYYAMYAQPYMHLLDDKTRTELLESYVKYIDEDLEISEMTITNDNAESFGIAPLKIDGQLTSEAFVEKAGNKYLFKLGELIGPQMEMYQAKKRVLPVTTQFTKNYHRELSFTIPEGYTINNLDDIRIENGLEKDGIFLFKFKSDYTVDGHVVKVICDEYYTVMEVAPEFYEDYRKVINSAADFNKITLILQPE